MFEPFVVEGEKKSVFMSNLIREVNTGVESLVSILNYEKNVIYKVK